MLTDAICQRPGCLENQPSPSDRAFRYVHHCAHGSPRCAVHVFMGDELMVVDARRGVLWTGSLTGVRHVALVRQGLAVELHVGGADGQTQVRELGPLLSEDAAAVASSLRRMTSRDELLEVSAEELSKTPGRFHGRLISTEGNWSWAFEASHFAGAWLTWPRSGRAPTFGSARRVRTTGLWLSKNGRTEESDSDTENGRPRWGGYGHMGMSMAELIAYELQFLD